jgi:uncharacterized coiled-coil protein SlyX
VSDRIERLEQRADDHEERLDDHEKRLGQGDVGFAELRKDISALTEKVGDLVNAAKWLVALLVVGVLGSAGGALVWALGRMGQS